MASNTLTIQVADSDGDLTFSGNGTEISQYIWGAQVEAAAGGYMSSYIPTATVPATRNVDYLRFKGDDGNLGGVGSDLKGSLSFDLLLEDYADINTAGRLVFELSDNGTSGDRITAGTLGNNVIITLAVNTDGGAVGSIASSSDIVDGKIHHIALTWATNSLKLYVDGVLVGTDSAVGIPDDLDVIDIGQRAGGNLLNGVITNFKIHRRPTKK